MRIALVGPTYPFRGGIAHHTTILCKTLRAKHDVRFYTFSRQYPQLLFPGKTDMDSSRDVVIRESAEAVIDGLNPFSWRRAARQIAAFCPDLVIIPWWTSFFALAFRTIARTVRKRTIAPILFVCHNVIEHERRFYGTAPTRLALGQGHIFIVHSEEERENLLRLLPDAIVRKAYLPVGRSFSEVPVNREAAKRALNATGNVLLFFGFVRPYKGLRYLIEALPEVLKRNQVTLVVAGEFWKNKADHERLIRDMNLEGNVRLVDRYIPNEEVGTYFAACDTVVLPYVGASQSGIIQLAYEFGRPVIATTAGGLPDVVEDGKTGYLVPPRDSRALADAIVKMFNADRAAMEQSCRNRASMLSWDALVEQIELLHEQWNAGQGSAQDKGAELAANRSKLDEQGDRFSSSGWDGTKFARALRPLEPFLAEARPPRRVLEIGCGGMALTAELFARGLRPVAIDLDETLLQTVSIQRVPEACLASADAEQLPFRDESFDLVIHNQTLHHFPRRDRVLREIRRVLKPNGKLCSIETNGWNPYVRYIHGPPWERSRRYISSNQRVFGLRRFVSELRRAGLEPVSRKMINFDFIKILSPLDGLFGRIPLFNLIFGGSMVVCSEKPGDEGGKAGEE
jgi:glycosyltransferase involved in cell wall biosynthesis/SAM-dependent methyltransferase